MSFPWIHEKSQALVSTILSTANQLLRNLGSLILAILVWLELKTGLVLASFALYEKNPHIINIALSKISLDILHRLARLIKRRWRTPEPADPFAFKSSPYRHRRQQTPMFPPGMEFNHVQERWKREGMEKPFLERRDFGAGRPAEVSPVRRPLFCVPAGNLPPPQPVRPPMNAAFGKPGWC